MQARIVPNTAQRRLSHFGARLLRPRSRLGTATRTNGATGGTEGVDEAGKVQLEFAREDVLDERGHGCGGLARHGGGGGRASRDEGRVRWFRGVACQFCKARRGRLVFPRWARVTPKKLCACVRTLRCRVLFDQGLDAFDRQPVSCIGGREPRQRWSKSRRMRMRGGGGVPVKLMSLGTLGTSVLMTLLKSISCSSRWYTVPVGVTVFLNG